MTDTSRFTKNLELVKRGNPNAQYHFGLCYRNGEGVDQDHKEAIKWLKKAAIQGDARAQYHLACCSGKGVEQDYEEAVKWYRKAAEQGHRDAQYHMGGCYLSGQGVERDYDEGIKWWRKAAEQGQLDATRFGDGGAGSPSLFLGSHGL